MLLKGKIVSQEGEGLNNLPVEVFLSNDFSSFSFERSRFPSDLVRIGRNTTQGNGDFTILIPAPTYYGNLFISSNDPRSLQYDDGKGSLALTGIDRTMEQDETILLQPWPLTDIVSYQINFIRNLSDTDTLVATFRYNKTLKILSLDQETDLSLDFSNQTEKIVEFLPGEGNRNERLEVLKNDTIYFSYQITNRGIVQNDSVMLIANENTNRYDFEF